MPDSSEVGAVTIQDREDQWLEAIVNLKPTPSELEREIEDLKAALVQHDVDARAAIAQAQTGCIPAIPVTVICQTCGYLLTEELVTLPNQKIRVLKCPMCSERPKEQFYYY